jgi:hypothetical protein
MLQFFGGALHWSDNSNDEDGFRVTARTGGAAAPLGEFTVGRNDTAFQIPDSALPLCPVREAMVYEVRAYRGPLVSVAAITGVTVDCASVGEDTRLPSTGTGGAQYPGREGVWFLAALSGGWLAILAGVASAARERRQCKAGARRDS